MRGEGVSCGVSSNAYSCARHVTWSPNKLWRSTSIFNLCHLPPPTPPALLSGVPRGMMARQQAAAATTSRRLRPLTSCTASGRSRPSRPRHQFQPPAPALWQPRRSVEDEGICSVAVIILSPCFANNCLQLHRQHNAELADFCRNPGGFYDIFRHLVESLDEQKEEGGCLCKCLST